MELIAHGIQMIRDAARIVLLTILVGCDVPKVSDLFLKGHSLGRNDNPRLEEASGLVASVRNPGYLWTHNDGGKAELFLLDTNAVVRKVFTLAGIRNRDWEDIALGPGPEPGVNYIYVGDIGDNFARYPVKFIYRLKEPALDDPETISEFDTIKVRLSDAVRDAETLMIDPAAAKLYIVSKRDHEVGLYELGQIGNKDTVVANRIADLPLRSIVAGSISSDGKEVLLKSYETVFYWKRSDHEPLEQLLMTKPLLLPYKREPQGESIAWALSGSGFYTLGENARGERAKLFFYRRNKK